MTKGPLLSLILCSRNDHYMGNSAWRLQTALNYVAARVAELKRETDVEILVTDWGSEVPLHTAVRLSPEAARMTRFLVVPKPLAHTLQKDSPFSEVHALNAAARRARGQYIGRIDQDTLVGPTFLERFLKLADGSERTSVAIDRAFLFAKRKNIPYRVARQCPSCRAVERFVRWFKGWLAVQHPTTLFFHAAVGIMIMHRQVWDACGGYDERLIYMNNMEPDLASRVALNYELVNLEHLTGIDFYHLDHCAPLAGFRTPRKENPWDVRFAKDKVLRPNGPEWGLRDHALEVATVTETAAARNGSWVEGPAFALLLLSAAPGIAWDRVVESCKPLIEGWWTWQRRARSAAQAIHGQPPAKWPGLLRAIWVEGHARRAQQEHAVAVGSPEGR